MDRKDKARKHGQRLAHQRKLDDRQTVKDGPSADERRNVARDERRRVRREAQS